MTSQLLDRMVMLLKADAHGVVESLEERSLLLKQCVREAEIELGRKRARLEVVREEARRLGEALARTEADVRALDADVTLALTGDKDDLARFAARRLLARQRDAQTLRAQIHERANEADTLAERLDQQQAQFESLRSRVRGELAQRAETDDPTRWSAEPAVADEEVELELLRRRQRQAEEGGR
jgi:phage shock protein A